METEREKENVLDSTDVVCSSISSFFFFLSLHFILVATLRVATVTLRGKNTTHTKKKHCFRKKKKSKATLNGKKKKKRDTLQKNTYTHTRVINMYVCVCVIRYPFSF